jgi:hypothetical protein
MISDIFAVAKYLRKVRQYFAVSGNLCIFASQITIVTSQITWCLAHCKQEV